MSHCLTLSWVGQRVLEGLWFFSLLLGPSTEWIVSKQSFIKSRKACRNTYRCGTFGECSVLRLAVEQGVVFVFTCVHAKLLQPCLTLSDSMDCSLPGSSVHGILQVRILEWVATPSSRGSSVIPLACLAPPRDDPEFCDGGFLHLVLHHLDNDA